MPTSSEKFSKGYKGKKKKPEPPRQSGGTSGDLSIPDYEGATPTVIDPKYSYRGPEGMSPPPSAEPSDLAASLLSDHSKGGGKSALAKLMTADLPVIEGITHGPAATEFAEWLAYYSGFDPQVVGAWVQAEGGGSEGSGVSGGEAGKNNWLGVGYPGERTPFSESDYFNGTPRRAAKATADWIKGKIGSDYDYHAAPSIEGLQSASGGSAEDFLKAFESSEWGTGTENIVANLPNIGVGGVKKVKVPTNVGAPAAPVDSPLAFEGDPSDVRTAGEVIPHHKLFKWLEGAGGNTANRENIANLNPVFARHLLRAAIKSGDPLLITSAQRMEEEQAEIDPGTNPAAPPGYSVHQFGGAADTEPTPEQVKLLEQEGIEHGYAGGEPDPPHTEFTDPRLIKRMTRFGPVRSGYAPPGLEEAVGDITDWSSDGVSSGGAVAPSSSLGSLGTAVASSPSTGGYSGSDNPILNAALNQTAPGKSGDNEQLINVLGFLDSPVPQIGAPLEPLQPDDELYKRALKGVMA